MSYFYLFKPTSLYYTRLKQKKKKFAIINIHSYHKKCYDTIFVRSRPYCTLWISFGRRHYRRTNNRKKNKRMGQNRSQILILPIAGAHRAQYFDIWPITQTQNIQVLERFIVCYRIDIKKNRSRYYDRQRYSINYSSTLYLSQLSFDTHKTHYATRLFVKC